MLALAEWWPTPHLAPVCIICKRRCKRGENEPILAGRTLVKHDTRNATTGTGVLPQTSSGHTRKHTTSTHTPLTGPHPTLPRTHRCKLHILHSLHLVPDTPHDPKHTRHARHTRLTSYPELRCRVGCVVAGQLLTQRQRLGHGKPRRWTTGR